MMAAFEAVGAPMGPVDQGAAQEDGAGLQEQRALDEAFEAKIEVLKGILSGCGAAVAGYCGDAASSLLAACLVEALPEGAASVVFADGFLFSDEYRDVVLSNAARLEIPLQVVDHQGFSKPAVLRNEVLRCYRCRVGLFDAMLDEAPAEDAALLVGYTADRMEDAIRGRKAMTEYEVSTPLAQAGITTAEAKAWAAAHGLAECPPLECVAVRFELNNPVSEGMVRAFAETDQAVRAVLQMPAAKVFDEGCLTSVVMPYSALRDSSEWDVPVPDVDAQVSEGLAADATAPACDEGAGGGATSDEDVHVASRADVPTEFGTADCNDLEPTELELEGVLATINRAIGGGALDELLDARRKHEEELERAMEELATRRQALLDVGADQADADTENGDFEQDAARGQAPESAEGDSADLTDPADADGQPPAESERPALMPTVAFLEHVQELLGTVFEPGRRIVLETAFSRRARRSAAVQETPMARRRR